MSEEKFVFISYAHKDSAFVLPCVEAMRRAGISVWYDEGIQAGSEWPEYIASKVVSCTKFVLFISPAYLESQNCKRELNFAISRKKDLLSLFIDEVELSPGVEMQLGTYQSIFKNRFSSDDEFLRSICNEQWFNECRISGEAPVETAPPQPKAPVYTQPQPQAPVYTPPQPQAPVYTSSQAKYNAPQNTINTQKTRKPRSKITAAWIALFLGFLGIHMIYLRKPLLCIPFIIVTVTLPQLGFLVGVANCFLLLFMKNELFNEKFNK